MDFAPQNTVPSFLLARDQGADGVELDVQLTRDGVPVVFHDARVDALTDGRGPISALTWDEVRRLDAGFRFGPGWKGTRIPTLEEVLTILDDRLVVNVELKTALSEDSIGDRWRTMVFGPRRVSAAIQDRARREAEPLAAAVAGLLTQGRPERYVVSSFDPLALEAIGPQVPRIPLGFLHAPQVPWDTPALMDRVAYQAWHPHHSQVTAEAVASQRAAGRKIHVWTANDPGVAVRLARLGVDALITNRPAEVLAALEGVTRG
jgi:glycerophosphoryl diester phosphodiesterase